MSQIRKCICRFDSQFKKDEDKKNSGNFLFTVSSEDKNRYPFASTRFELNISEMDLPDEGVSILSGPSGSGKSTFALALCGLQPTQPGFEWWFKGKNLANLSPPDRRISLLFQTLELFPHLTARQNILFPVEIYLKNQLPKHLLSRAIDMFRYALCCPSLTPLIEDRFNLLKTSLRLDSFLDRPVSVLSGGEKQRTALARALIIKSQFVILDEPFAFLDASLKMSVVLLLEKIVEIDKLPILLITHHMKQVKTLASRIFYLQNGRLQDEMRG